jgi:hypothetical protein
LQVNSGALAFVRERLWSRKAEVFGAEKINLSPMGEHQVVPKNLARQTVKPSILIVKVLLLCGQAVLAHRSASRESERAMQFMTLVMGKSND